MAATGTVPFASDPEVWVGSTDVHKIWSWCWRTNLRKMDIRWLDQLFTGAMLTIETQNVQIYPDLPPLLHACSLIKRRSPAARSLGRESFFDEISQEELQSYTEQQLDTIVAHRDKVRIPLSTSILWASAKCQDLRLGKMLFSIRLSALQTLIMCRHLLTTWVTISLGFKLGSVNSNAVTTAGLSLLIEAFSALTV